MKDFSSNKFLNKGSMSKTRSAQYEIFSIKTENRMSYIERSKEAKKKILKYQNRKGFFQKFWSFMSGCYKFDVPSSRKVHIQIYRLVKHLQDKYWEIKDYILNPHGSKPSIILMRIIFTGEKVDFYKLSMEESVNILLVYMRGILDGLWDHDVAEMIFKKIIRMPEGIDLLKNEGLWSLSIDRQILLIELLKLFLKIDSRGKNIEYTYEKYIKKISKYLFPKELLETENSQYIEHVTAIICHRDNLEDVCNMLYK